MNHSIEDQELQRLLDGVLPTDERELLLQHADEHPSNWRKIALAFVEEQVLRDELAAMLTTGENDVTDADRTGVFAGARRIRWSVRFSQAAVLLLLLGVSGWLGRQSAETSDSLEQSKSYAVVFTPQTPAPPDGSRESEKTQALSATESALARELVAMKNMLSPIFDQKERNDFRSFGYEVAEEPVIYVVEGQQGEQYLVPHRNVTLASYRD